MKNFLIIICFGALLTVGWGCRNEEKRFDPEAEASLADLDLAIKNAAQYRTQKYHEIDSMEDAIAKVKSDDYGVLYRQNARLANVWNPVNGDSALVYARKALKYANLSANQENILYARIREAKSLAYGGFYLEAMKQLEAMSDSLITPNVKLEYWSANVTLYRNLAQFVPKGEYRQEYINKFVAYGDSLIYAIPHTNVEHRYYYGEQLYYTGQYNRCVEIMSQVVDQVAKGGELESRSCLILASAYKALGDNNEYVKYVARAAQSNIKNVRYIGVALAGLADYLFEAGDINRAYEYLNFTISALSKGNGRMRSIALASSLPTIEEAYRDKLNRSYRAQLWIAVIACVLVLAILLIVFYYKRKGSRLEDVTSELESSHNAQEVNVENLIALCYSYCDSMNSYANLVQRKVNAGETEGLQKLVGKYTGKNSDLFCRVFDEAFLSSYPDFLGNLNKLLRKGERFELKGGKEMSAELRLCAILRVGVDDTSKIATLMGYSPNSIYVYRNKIRNRAISKDTFDDDVKNC